MDCVKSENIRNAFSPPFFIIHKGNRYILQEEYPAFKTRSEAKPIVMELRKKQEEQYDSHYVRVKLHMGQYFIYKGTPRLKQ